MVSIHTTRAAVLSGFTPTPPDLGSCIFWLPASRIPALKDGDAIDAQPNLAPTAVPFVGTGSNRPTYRAGVLNGSPVVRYAASATQYLTADALATYFTGNDVAFTVMLVAKVTSALIAHQYWSAGNSGSNTQFIGFRAIMSSSLYRAQRTDDTNAGAAQDFGTPDTAWHIFAHRFTGTTVELYVDGAQVGGTKAQDVGPLTLNEFTIGNFRRAGVSQAADMDLADAAGFSVALAPDQIVRLTRAWARQFALVSA